MWSLLVFRHTRLVQTTDDISAELTTNLLHSWNCINSIVCMTFDTTAANTSSVTAACVLRIDSTEAGPSLLWCACRHHFGKVIFTHVFHGLHIESSKLPHIMLFSTFLKNFYLLPHTTNAPLSELDLSTLTDEARQLVKVSPGSVEGGQV